VKSVEDLISDKIEDSDEIMRDTIKTSSIMIED